MKLAEKGEKFSENVIFNDKFSLVSVREPEVNKVTIIGPGIPFITLNEKNEISGFKIANIASGQILEKEDWPTLRGWIVAFYETEKGKKESIRSQAKQLAEILESEAFSNIKTIELIGVGKIGLLFLIASQYVERRLHIATINLKLCFPYLEYTYCKKENLEKLKTSVRKRYEKDLLKYIDFEDLSTKHKWIDFEDKEWLQTYSFIMLLWINIVNRKLKSENSKKIQDMADRNFLIDTKYSNTLKEIYRYFER